MQPRKPFDTGVDAGRTEAALKRAEPGRPGRVRVRSLAARAAAGFLAAFAALVALPLQVQAQTTFVSNTGQVADSDFSGGTRDRAQAFTTGANSGGYILSSVEIISGDTNGDDARVAD